MYLIMAKTRMENAAKYAENFRFASGKDVCRMREKSWRQRDHGWRRLGGI